VSIILWNRTTRNVLYASTGQPFVFRDAAEAKVVLDDDPGVPPRIPTPGDPGTTGRPRKQGLLSRLIEEAERAGLPSPVIEQVTVG
jgi:hypothetical protein